MVGAVDGHQKHVDIADGAGHVRRPIGPVAAQVQEADAAGLEPQHHVGEVPQPRRTRVQVQYPSDGHVPVDQLPGHPEQGRAFGKPLGVVMIEMGVGDQAQAALDAGEQPGEPVPLGYVAVPIGQHPQSGLRLQLKGER